ncbi:uncharacterized protein [Spinacia oleracea]|uniref:Reverse transcriptase domain-containing protein n=1 Tax=Spinacia oleracea TaxID=3562 RepID=A0ABM3QZA9_SPIOL|nr:uncharacterized protein LOC130463569 [Spinacia oleracea]
MKERWMAEGDFPTQLLYSRVKVRQKKNKILSLKDQSGNWVEGQQHVQDIVVDSLKQGFKCDLALPANDEVGLVLRELQLPQISSSQVAMLSSPFLDNDIRTSMFAMGDSKSPGPDGFTAGFFKKHWEKVRPSVCDAVRSFLTTGYLLKEWNHSLLVMIPKREMPEETGYLRPISLCNTVYKCASKCLVGRMKVVLPSLISPAQHAFISGRFMTDNILLSHELIEKINTRRRGKGYLGALKIDMSKAYDRVHWDFLLQVLRAYGFPQHWIQLVHQCISTVSYKVLVNGSISDQFRPTCGIRQGDPLSPYLFLFCMDVLSRMLQLGNDLGYFQGIRLMRGGPQMTHLFFADDVLLFFTATTNSCSQLVKVLNRFCGISGQQLNLQKSHFKISPNTPVADQQGFKDIFKMQLVQNFGMHLGVPVDLVGKKHTNFQFLVDKVAGKISAWNSCHLSQPQKLILINSVLIAMVSHVFNCMEVPLSISTKLDSILTRFFWASKSIKGIHWVSKKVLQHPKGLGGLGIRSASCLNKALLMKHVWRLSSNSQSMLAATVDRKFLKPLHTGIQALLVGRRLSWGMRGMGRAFNNVLRGCSWKIGNGKKVSAGGNKWVLGGIPIYSSHVTLQQAKDWKVHHFIHPLGAGWNHERIQIAFEFQDARKIVGLELPTSDTEDFLYWDFHKSGKFTVKTAYAMLAVEESSDMINVPQNNIYKMLWSSGIHPKWKLFLWKLLHNGLATKVNLGRKGIQVSILCDVCGCGEEDIQHLFRFCNFAQHVWRSGSLAIHSEFNETMSFSEWFLFYIRQFQRQDGNRSLRIVSFISTLWGLWLTRNNRVFRGEISTIAIAQALINKGMSEHGFLRNQKHPYLGFLHPPEDSLGFPPGFFRAIISGTEDQGAPAIILVDGSWHKITGNAGMGWVLDGQYLQEGRILGGAQPGTSHSALQSEAKACLLGLRWASQSLITRVTILTDSHRLVELLRGDAMLDVQIMWTVAEIKKVGKTFSWCCVNKVDRQQVQQAHELATAASTSLLWFNTFA